METLGLSGPPVRNENIFRRIFWPSADSVDADMLGQQGFWICLLLALLTVIEATFRGHVLLGVLFAIFYFLGGIGVREHDIASAISVTVSTSVCTPWRPRPLNALCRRYRGIPHPVARQRPRIDP